MRTIIGVTLLLLIVVDSLYSSTASRAKSSVTMKDILSCTCTRTPKGRRKCSSKNKEKWELNDCLCRKAKEKNRRELYVYCNSAFAAPI